MKKKIYYKRRKFERYDEKHFIVYLNEKVIPDYTETDDSGNKTKPMVAYEYEGTENDGGTIISCQEATRDNFVDALIRCRYSLSQENAIKTHRLQLIGQEVPTPLKQDEYGNEWAEFNQWREKSKAIVDSWFKEE